jgi:hypothetical protein
MYGLKMIIKIFLVNIFQNYIQSKETLKNAFMKNRLNKS